MQPFRFQQFSVIQAQSGMKVCTDATLFGAMAPVRGGERVLDIGTGTGLLALMAAQLGAAHVTAVELTAQAHAEARRNFANSPWTERLTAVHGPIQSFDPGERYDLVISNPPFFADHSRATHGLRNTARHADQLPYSELLAAAERLLRDDGLFYALLPLHAVNEFVAMAQNTGLHCIRRVDFRGYVHNPPKVSALTFSRHAEACEQRLLTIYRGHREYSAGSARYLAPFLLRFAADPKDAPS